MESLKQNNDLTNKKLQIEPLMTTFEWYSEKFVNFKNHIKKIATYYPRIEKWSNDLQKIDLAVFIQMSNNTFLEASKLHTLGELEERDEAARGIIRKLSQENNFDLYLINEDDMIKLNKYAVLFSIMLAE
jgi:hypothetical protein